VTKLNIHDANYKTWFKTKSSSKIRQQEAKPISQQTLSIKTNHGPTQTNIKHPNKPKHGSKTKQIQAPRENHVTSQNKTFFTTRCLIIFSPSFIFQKKIRICFPK